MDAAAAPAALAGARARARVPAARLPQQPRKREEFAASTRLAGAGAKIAIQGQDRAAAAAPSPRLQAGAVHSQRGHAGAPRRRLPPVADGKQAKHSPGRAETPSGSVESELLEALDRDPLSGRSHEVTAASSPTHREETTDAEESAEQHGHVNALELARGGEALLRRLADLSNANVDLRRQLEHQVKEVSTLEEAGRNQQQLLREFERQAEQARRTETAEIEARVRAEVAQQEEELRQKLQEVTEQAGADREELIGRLQQAEGQCRQREGERDEARERVRQVEARLDAKSADSQEKRIKALEMELQLVRARFAREVEAKEAAERSGHEIRTQQQDLKAQLEREVNETRNLQRALAEQSELATFRQEICNDLQKRLKEQKTEADQRLKREKGKMEAVSRLEGILPKHFLMHALA